MFKNKRKIITDILFLLTNLILFHRYITGVNAFTADRVGILLCIVLIPSYSLLGFKFLLKKENIGLYLIIFFGLIVMLIKGFIIGSFAINIFLNILLSSIIGIVILKNGLNKLLQLIFLLVVHGYIIFLYLQGIFPSQILTNYSYNHISILLLYSTILFYLSYNQLEIKTRQYSLIPAFSCMILSMFSIGRSGILSCSIMFLLLFFLKYKNKLLKSTNIIKKIGYFSIAIVLIYLLDYSITYIQENNYFYRFQSGGLKSDAREFIISEYWRNLDVFGLILGNKSTFFEEITGYTAHISYLNWHNTFGLVSIPLFFYIFYSIFQYNKYHDRYHLSLLIVILIRSATDDVLLFGGLMFGILFIILIFSSHNQILIKYKNIQKIKQINN